METSSEQVHNNVGGSKTAETEEDTTNTLKNVNNEEESSLGESATVLAEHSGDPAKVGDNNLRNVNPQNQDEGQPYPSESFADQVQSLGDPGAVELNSNKPDSQESDEVLSKQSDLRSVQTVSKRSERQGEQQWDAEDGVSRTLAIPTSLDTGPASTDAAGLDTEAVPLVTGEEVRPMLNVDITDIADTVSEDVELGLDRPLPQDLGGRLSAESMIKLIYDSSSFLKTQTRPEALEPGPASLGAEELVTEAAPLVSGETDHGVKSSSESMGKLALDGSTSTKPNPPSYHATSSKKRMVTSDEKTPALTLKVEDSGTSNISLVEAHSGKVALVRIPTALLNATDSEYRRMVGIPETPPEPTVLEGIWSEPVKYHDVRSVLSQIWAKDDKVFHSLLSQIWESPAIRSILSEIWEEMPPEPKSVLSEIWEEPPEHIDVRSVLSQIWSDDNKQRLVSILSEIWSTPAMRSILSEIWGSDPLRSILSEIWATPVEKVDIRSILSQIWSHDRDEPPPKSILSEIWETPAVRGVLSEIWGEPKPLDVLWEIWKEPVQKIDIRSILSQIWSKDNDVVIRSILSEIWATPAMRSVLSEIWHSDEPTKPLTTTRRDFRATESEVLLKEMLDELQHSEPESEERTSFDDLRTLVERDAKREEKMEKKKHRVHRFVGDEAEERDLPASRPLTTRWAFGASCKTPVLNLTSSSSTVIVYGAAQCAIIFDYCRNTQHALQGHRNCVCGLAASPDGRWVVSGDIGPDNALIVWDATTSAPLQMHFATTAFSGPLALAFSHDSRYIYGLWGCVTADGATPNDAARESQPGGESATARQQVICWDWTLAAAEPTVIYDYGSNHGFHEHIAVSQFDALVFATTASCRVTFFRVVNGKAEHHSPGLRNKFSPEFKCNPGSFAQTAFSTQDPYAAVSGTSRGYIVLWSDCRPSASLDPLEQPPTVKKEARKVLKLTDAAITCVAYVDGVIAAGMATGEIRFIDSTLRLLTWYQKFELGPICCMSLGLERARTDREVEEAGGDSAASSAASAPRAAAQPAEAPERVRHPPGSTGAAADQQLLLACAGPAGEHGLFPADASLEAAEFALRDILVTTSDGFCGMIHVRKSAITPIMRFPVVPVRAVGVHSKKPQLVIGSYDGVLRVWNYETKQIVGEVTIEGNNQIHSVAFSPSGLHVAVGMTTGELLVLDALTLAEECARFELSRGAITQCVFSPDSDLLATRDDDRAVSVYRFAADTLKWQVVGRWRAHHQPVVGLLFVESQTQAHKTRLLSLGEDRVLVEYDLVNSVWERPLVLCCDTIDQQAVPLCMVAYPPLTTEQFILVANSQFKMKLYNAHTRMCRSVKLGPRYGAPIENMKVIPRMMTVEVGLNSEQHTYLAFSTCGRLGLQVLPLDGNPNRSAAVIGHPAKVEAMECSADGVWLFTAGGDDRCVFMWEINPQALEAMALLGGAGMVPFYDQLEGGRGGPLYQQLEDLVYYTQLLCEGEDRMEDRAVDQNVPLYMVTDIVRAVGFFPTQKEVEDMTNEVLYSEYGETGKLVEEVNLNDIVRLYVNHRPIPEADVTGLEVAWSMEALARGGKYEQRGAVARRELLHTLRARGEHFSDKELAGVLAELLDPEADVLAEGVPLEDVEKQLRKTISLRGLCVDLLRMPELLENVRIQSGQESVFSDTPSATAGVRIGSTESRAESGVKGPDMSGSAPEEAKTSAEGDAPIVSPDKKMFRTSKPKKSGSMPLKDTSASSLAKKSGSTVANKSGSSLAKTSISTVANKSGSSLANTSASTAANKSGVSLAKTSESAVTNELGSAVPDKAGPTIPKRSGSTVMEKKTSGSTVPKKSEAVTKKSGSIVATKPGYSTPQKYGPVSRENEMSGSASAKKSESVTAKKSASLATKSSETGAPNKSGSVVSEKGSEPAAVEKKSKFTAAE